MVRGPTTDPKFLGTLESWFQSQPEILALIRIRCGAGAKDFEFFPSYEALKNRIRELSPGTCITVFKQPQLPLRGVVDDNFIAKCLSNIPDGSEYLIVETKLTIAGRASWFHYGSDVSHATLREDLEESRGIPVAVGLYPPALDDTNDVIHAIVPDEDGVVRAGPY
jgi:hypothetical protein